MVVKTIFLVSRGHFWRINFLFHKNFKFFICFQTLRKTFRIFGENNLVGLSKVFSSVQGIFLEEFFLKTNSLNCFSFLVFGHKFLDFRWKFCDSFVKTAFFVSIGDFWLDCFFYENLWVFSPSSGFEEKILALWWKSFKKCVKMQFMWTKKLCGKFDFWRKNFCIFFEYLSKILRTFLKKCWVRENFE